MLILNRLWKAQISWGNREKLDVLLIFIKQNISLILNLIYKSYFFPLLILMRNEKFLKTFLAHLSIFPVFGRFKI